jgi:hypothetical protein
MRLALIVCLALTGVVSAKRQGGSGGGGSQPNAQVTVMLNQAVQTLRAIQSTNNAACNQTGDSRLWNALPKATRAMLLQEIGITVSANDTLDLGSVQQKLNATLNTMINSIPYADVKNLISQSRDVIRVDFCVNEQALDKFLDNTLNAFVKKVLKGDEASISILNLLYAKFFQSPSPQ